MDLYSTTQIHTARVSSETVAGDSVLAPLVVMQSADLQSVSVPPDSDTQWTPSAPAVDRLRQSLVTGSRVTVSAHWSLARESTPFMTHMQSHALVPAAELLTLLERGEGRIVVQGLFPEASYLDASPTGKAVEDKGSVGFVTLTLHRDSATGGQWWSMDGLVDPLLFISERAMGSRASQSTGPSVSFSVVGLYIGVVLTIGRFLRVSIQGSSKRIMTEELPSTGTLSQVCQGIQIARLFRDPVTEAKLYYDLIRLFRDPQLLIAATRRSLN
jgi:hypothetical protein